MSLTETPSATQRIQFRCNAYLAGPMGDVFQFLLRNKAHTKRVGKTMATDAISAFWKPFSARAILEVSEEEAKAIALRSLDELQRQMDLIRTAFNLQNYSPGITRSELEAIIDSRLKQTLRSPSEALPTPTSVPIPDNYNTHIKENEAS